VFDVCTVSMQWSRVETKGNNPEPRSGHSATLFGLQVYVYGGFDGKSYHNDLYALDIRTYFLILLVCKLFGLTRGISKRASNGANWRHPERYPSQEPGTQLTKSEPRYFSLAALEQVLTMTFTF